MSQPHHTVLVIGASGFLGRHVVRTLLADGRRVRALVRTPQRVRDLATAGAEVVQGDMLDAGSVERALSDVQAVYICVHTLSRQRKEASGQDFMDVEQTGLQNIVQGCQSAGVRCVIYVTSLGVAPGASSAWTRGRWTTEQFLLTSGLDVTIFRPGMIVGRGGTGFDTLISGARRPVATVLGSGGQRMRTIAVEDFASIMVGVLDDPRAFGHAFDVGSDDVLTMDEMVDIAADVLGRRPPIKLHVPTALLGVLSPLLERIAGLPRGAFRGLTDGMGEDMIGDPAPIMSLHPQPLRSYRQAVAHALEAPASSRQPPG